MRTAVSFQGVLTPVLTSHQKWMTAAMAAM